MAVDRPSFLFLAGSIAAAGFAGWEVRDHNLFPAAATPPPAPAVPPAAPGPVPVTVIEADQSAAPACNDEVGTAEECPAVGPSDEGVCSNVLAKRCGEFKSAFKPRVAQMAVACLRQLKGAERCDAVRVNACGHAALMAACPDQAPPIKASYQARAANTPASVTLSRDPDARESPTAKACRTVAETCHGQSPGVATSDCLRTLAGMNETGRAMTVECVTAHCADRGLLGCEGVPKMPTVTTREATHDTVVIDDSAQLEDRSSDPYP